jgi:hypothetical protein
MRPAVPASVPGAPVRAGAVRIRDIPVHRIHRQAAAKPVSTAKAGRLAPRSVAPGIQVTSGEVGTTGNGRNATPSACATRVVDIGLGGRRSGLGPADAGRRRSGGQQLAGS